MKWVDIKGWPYQVSNGGKVRNKETGRVLVPMWIGWDGDKYAAVTLCDVERSRTITVHRLVAEAFLGERTAPLVLHKNGDRRNNRPSNLYYGTRKDNMRDARRHHQGKHKLTLRQVEQIRRRRAAGERGKDLAQEFDVSEQYVCDIHNGRK